MPTVLRVGGYQFGIYLNDHPPAHVHVRKAEKSARVTIDPIEVMNNYGFNERELSQIKAIIEQHQTELMDIWKRYHE